MSTDQASGGDNDALLGRWLGYGADLAGALTGAGVGATVAGPPGAALGAIMGTGIVAALGEASHRALSAREKRRIGAVVAMARSRLIDRLGTGAMLRRDDFVRARLDGRSAADEVIEHVLQAAQRSFEERKLPHIAAALSAVAVSEWLDERTAHWTIAALENLSWPKLVAVALVNERDAYPLPDKPIGKSLSDWAPWSLHNVFYELQYSDSLVRRTPRRGQHGEPDFSSYFSDMQLTHGGKLLAWAGDLESIAPAERDAMRRAIDDATK
jgi:hypothetical protein